MEETIEVDLYVSEIEKQAKRDDVFNVHGLVTALFDENVLPNRKTDFRNENQILNKLSYNKPLSTWYFAQIDVVRDDLQAMIAKAVARKVDYHTQDVIDVEDDLKQIDSMAKDQGWKFDVDHPTAIERLCHEIGALSFNTVEARAARKIWHEELEAKERAAKIEAEKARRVAYLTQLQLKKEAVSTSI